MEQNNEIELEKTYGSLAIANKLRRIADAIEQNRGFQIQINNQRFYVPVDVEVEFEYEEANGESELEIELKWKK
ncbi:amphi-Trp domain-containing protein [Legionella saoudiensis]|uniref:amphi-Trp domain-containing protein n=1 Tax=Legionella saoudiensis TaxID=1750561 RepID=UPI0007313F8A|nr:amphi-Trp domain-containing protein [Legionella saoudiensis]